MMCDSFRLYKVVETDGMTPIELQAVLDDATDGFPEMQIDYVVGTKIILGYESPLNAKGRAAMKVNRTIGSPLQNNSMY